VDWELAENLFNQTATDFRFQQFMALLLLNPKRMQAKVKPGCGRGKTARSQQAMGRATG
jgi:hypothetical protein